MYLPVYILSGDPALQEAVRKAAELAGCSPIFAGDREPEAGWPAPGLAVLEARDGGFADRREALAAVVSPPLPPLVAVLASGVIASFPVGLDDFIQAGASPEAIAARLRFVVTRAHAGEGEAYLRAGHLAVNLTACLVTLEGRPVDLTLKEYQLLVFLMQHPGRLYSREQLLAEVWGYDYFGGTRTVDVHVRRLRMKIGDLAEQTISTVRGMGYRFDPPVDDSTATH